MMTSAVKSQYEDTTYPQTHQTAIKSDSLVPVPTAAYAAKHNYELGVVQNDILSH